MDLYKGSRTTDHEFILESGEYHHCLRVARHKSGDEILVTDFNGNLYHGIINEIQNEQLTVRITGLYKSEDKETATISIAISLTKPIDRFEWFVEKAVENGVHYIIPLICQRSETNKIRPDRINKIIESAAKQTLRPLKPILNELCRLEEFISDCKSRQKFIAHCEDDKLRFLGNEYIATQDAAVLIGPAGDFTKKEIELALSNEFKPISLGNYRLRTETAGLTALQILQTIRHISPI
jgi:16S rRNA (uracil1498-N3)-methyltransferase